jgi:D-threo-aldose 1-dehydrogenase
MSELTAGERRVGTLHPLGRSTVQVSALSLGTAPLGNLYTEVSDDASTATVQAALRLGLRYIDVAPFYGHGIAERRLGAALAGVPRDEVVISTKVGRLLRPDAGGALQPVFDFTADGVKRSVEESLHRLGLDRIDILYIHDPDDHLDQAIDEAYPALHQLRAEGVVGAIGAGMNFCAPSTRFVRETEVDAVLCAGRYTLLDQAGLSDLLPAATERGASIVIGGVYNSGVLADPRPGAHYNYEHAPESIVARAMRLDEVCREFGVPLKAAATQFPFGHPAIASVLTGARSAEEITENVAMFEHPVPPQLWQRLVELELLPAESVRTLATT